MKEFNMSVISTLNYSIPNEKKHFQMLYCSLVDDAAFFKKMDKFNRELSEQVFFLSELLVSDVITDEFMKHSSPMMISDRLISHMLRSKRLDVRTMVQLNRPALNIMEYLLFHSKVNPVDFHEMMFGQHKNWRDYLDLFPLIENDSSIKKQAKFADRYMDVRSFDSSLYENVDNRKFIGAIMNVRYSLLLNLLFRELMYAYLDEKGFNVDEFKIELNQKYPLSFSIDDMALVGNQKFKRCVLKGMRALEWKKPSCFFRCKRNVKMKDIVLHLC